MAWDGQARLTRRWTKSRYYRTLSQAPCRPRASPADRPPPTTRSAPRHALVVEVRTSTESRGAGGDHAAMTIVRSEHRAQFTIIPNAIFRDDRLSIEAKGVLGYLLSHPHHWQVHLDRVGRTLRIGRKKLQRIFRELTPATSPANNRGPPARTASAKPTTLSATYPSHRSGRWTCRLVRGSERDLRSRGAERAPHIKKARRSQTAPPIKK